MSLKSLAFQSCFPSQRRSLVSFACEQFKYRFLEMDPSRSRIQGRSANRGEGYMRLNGTVPTVGASFGGLGHHQSATRNTPVLSEDTIERNFETVTTGFHRQSRRGRGTHFTDGRLHNTDRTEIQQLESDLSNSVGRETDVHHNNFPTTSRFRGSARTRSQYRRRNEGEPIQADRIDALGRTLTKILRHQAIELGLKIRDDGFIEVMELLRLPTKTRAGLPLSSHNIEDVQEAVKQDNKQRLGLIKEDQKWWIRANQGHSLEIIDSEKLSKQITNAADFPVCIHGTYKRCLPAILEEGLKRMDRVHVHFATGLPGESGVISGMRKTCQVLIYLNLAKALQDNMKLYISQNGVILTEGFNGVVPPEYFLRVVEWPKGTEIPIPRTASSTLKQA